MITGWIGLSVYARRISFEKFPAIPAHLRRFRACAYTYTALRPTPPHLAPAWPDFFESRVAGSEMRRMDHLAPADPGRDTRPVLNQVQHKIFSGAALGKARCNRVVNSVSVGDGFEKARPAWAECGCVARSIGLHSMRARETRRRPKIADVFFEPNSPHCWKETLKLGLRA